MKKPPLAERAVAAVARYERAAAELTNIKRAIVAALDKCPITIEAFSDSGMESFNRGHSLLWDGTRPNTHLHRALTNTVSDYCSERRLDQEEISDQLTGWDDGDPDACPHCLAAWNLILSRKAARAELGQAKRQVRALGKLALLSDPKPGELVLTKCRLCDQLQADLTARDQRIDLLEQQVQLADHWLEFASFNSVGEPVEHTQEMRDEFRKQMIAAVFPDYVEASTHGRLNGVLP